MLSQSRFVLEIVNQASLYACVQREISVPTELALGHLRCCVTDMPPQPNSPSGRCLETRLSECHKDTRLVQFLGKDNIFFHALFFPAICEAHGGLKIANQVVANEFLNLEGQKFSSSRNHAVWLDDVLQRGGGLLHLEEHDAHQ